MITIFIFVGLFLLHGLWSKKYKDNGWKAALMDSIIGLFVGLVIAMGVGLFMPSRDNMNLVSYRIYRPRLIRSDKAANSYYAFYQEIEPSVYQWKTVSPKDTNVVEIDGPEVVVYGTSSLKIGLFVIYRPASYQTLFIKVGRISGGKYDG